MVFLNPNVTDFRTKTAFKGPILPKPMLYPCTVNINEDEIFIIGASIWEGQNQQAYVYNHKTNSDWRAMGENFPCSVKNIYDSRFSCAFLKHESVVVTAVDGCVAQLSVTSSNSNWTMSTLPFNNTGLIFNSNDKQNTVIFFGSEKVNGTFGTHVYAVRIDLSPLRSHLSHCCS